MIEAAGDRESEIHTDNSKEDISGSACSGEDTRHVSHNLTIYDGTTTIMLVCSSTVDNYKPLQL